MLAVSSGVQPGLNEKVQLVASSCQKLRVYNIAFAIFACIGFAGAAATFTASVLSDAITTAGFAAVACIVYVFVKEYRRRQQETVNQNFATLLSHDEGKWHKEIEQTLLTWGRYCPEIKPQHFSYGFSLKELQAAATEKIKDLRPEVFGSFLNLPDNHRIAGNFQSAIDLAVRINAYYATKADYQQDQAALERLEKTSVDNRTKFEKMIKQPGAPVWTRESIKCMIQACPQLNWISLRHPDANRAALKMAQELNRNIINPARGIL